MSDLPRTGIGTDIHAWAPEGDDRRLWLGCVEWPGERGIDSPGITVSSFPFGSTSTGTVRYPARIVPCSPT